MTNKTRVPEANRDPITGAPGAHPVGTGVGAAVGGMAAGAAAGTVAGRSARWSVRLPARSRGGLAGKAVAEHYDPTIEDVYWRENFERQPYYQKGMTYDDYAPAYRLGWESRGRYTGAKFDDIDADLARDYDNSRGKSRLSWDHAKHATRDAWHRVERAGPGGLDKDGR